MANESTTQIKTYFNKGDKPTESQYVNLIDTLSQILYSATRAYIAGEQIIIDNSGYKLYLCVTDTVAGESPITTPAKWELAGGGSGGVSFFDATIGTGGDYTTLNTAIAAAKYRLKAVGNITLSADISESANDLIIDLNGYDLSLVDKKLLIGTGGSLHISNGRITSDDPTLGGSYGASIAVSGDNELIIYNNIEFINISSANDLPIARGGVFYNCSFDLPNFKQAGVITAGILHNCRIDGGGTNCYDAFRQVDEIHGCILTGTFSTGNFSNVLYADIIENVINSSTSTVKLAASSFKDIGRDGTYNMDLVPIGETFINACHFNDIIESTGSGNFVHISNSTLNNKNVINSITRNYLLSNVTFQEAFEITKKTKGINLIFESSLTINTNNCDLMSIECTDLTLSSGAGYNRIYARYSGTYTNSSGTSTNSIDLI